MSFIEIFLFQYKDINTAACSIVKEVADEFGCLVAGPISTTISYEHRLGKEKVQKEVKKQVDVYKEKNMDFVLAEVK